MCPTYILIINNYKEYIFCCDRDSLKTSFFSAHWSYLRKCSEPLWLVAVLSEDERDSVEIIFSYQCTALGSRIPLFEQAVLLVLAPSETLSAFLKRRWRVSELVKYIRDASTSHLYMRYLLDTFHLKQEQIFRHLAISFTSLKINIHHIRI